MEKRAKIAYTMTSAAIGILKIIIDGIQPIYGWADTKADITTCWSTDISIYNVWLKKSK